MTIALVFVLAVQTNGNAFLDFVNRLKSAPTLSGRMTAKTVTSMGAGSGTTIFAFQRPNFSRVEDWDYGHLYRLGVGDGVNRWVFDGILGRVAKGSSAPEGFIEGIPLLDAFLDPRGSKSVERLSDGPQGVPATFHGHPALKFVITTGPGDPRLASKRRTLEVFMDGKTELPLGVTGRFGQMGTRSFETVFSDLKIGAPIDKATFTYHTSLPVNLDSQESWLLPLKSPAPHFSGMTLEGKHFDLASSLRRSKVLLLDFWGLGCAPCRAEFPGLADLQRRYSTQGLSVITVALGSDKETLSEYVQGAHIKLPVVPSISCKPDVAYAYKAEVEPTTYLINSKGTIVGRYMGDDLERIEKDLKRLGFRTTTRKDSRSLIGAGLASG